LNPTTPVLMMLRTLSWTYQSVITLTQVTLQILPFEKAVAAIMIPLPLWAVAHGVAGNVSNHVHADNTILLCENLTW
jgi:hypothetical protein